MKAMVCTAFGAPQALRLADIEMPAPAADEVLVRISASSVNFADLLMVAGQYQVKPPLPFVPGLEFVGEVTAIGAAVTRWRIGDRVMGAPAWGAFAEAVAVGQDRIFAVPDGMSDAVAAGFTIAYGTAAYALLVRGSLQAGDTLLVTGAGGGVGMAAIAIARRIGARVIAAIGSPAKAQAVREQGADEVVDSSQSDWGAALKRLTGGTGVDMLLDNVGGEVFNQALRGTARMGRVLVVGFAGGSMPRIPSEYLLVKNLTVHGVGFGGAIASSPEMARDTLERLASLHRQRPFEAHVATTFALAEVPQALALLGSRQAIGKLLIRVAA
ncbi:MAG TPA: NADPH:quinone oxidoreductase family protein [Variovorax sp.]|nr:NADPH:quinone oxidoreductase family protein [Variovorax sp.]